MRGSTRTVLTLAATLLATLAASPVAAQPPLTLAGLDGGNFNEADLNQGAHIIVVWAGWSPRCRDIVPRVNQIVAKWQGKARVVTINFQEDAAAARSFLGSQGLRAPVYLDTDGAFSKKHSIVTLPSLAVFKDGRNGYRGRLPENPDSVISQVIP